MSVHTMSHRPGPYCPRCGGECCLLDDSERYGTRTFRPPWPANSYEAYLGMNAEDYDDDDLEGEDDE